MTNGMEISVEKRPVEAIQKGAADYLTKPVDVQKLEKRVESLLSEMHKGARCLQLESELLENSQFASMVGHSAAMLEVFHRIRRVAPHFRSVLVTGETGVGKELAAQALHRLSPVVSGPFVTCNCSAIVETLALGAGIHRRPCGVRTAGHLSAEHKAVIVTAD